MKRLLGIALCGAAPLFFILAFARHETALAMPMFARKYGVSCATCHTTPPRLNQTGYRFRAAGFRMPEEIGKADETPFEILNYVSARVQVRAEAGRSRSGTATDTRHLFLLQVLELYPLTGAWGRHFSSDIKLTFAPTSSLVTPIENAYVKFNDGNEKRFLSARVGIFHPYDGYGAADSPATISRPFFQTAPANLNQTTFFTTWGFDQLGGEVGFDYGRTSVRAALLNGVVLSRDGTRLRASAAQGGPLTKPSAGPGHDSPDFQLFVNQALAREGGGLALHYYHGNLALPVADTGDFFRNEFDRTEVYASYPVAKRLHLFTGYERGRDRTAAGGRFSSTGAFAEASVPVSKLSAAGARYDWFDPAREMADNELRGVTAYVNAWFYSQLRVVAEYQHRETKHGAAPSREDDTFQVRFIYIK